MIVVDTSALYAIMTNEDDAGSLKRRLSFYRQPIMSAPTWLEASIVCGMRSPVGLDRMKRVVAALGILLYPFDETQAEIAAEAYRRFGRGSGSPARLNFGDCFAYALARHLGLPLLFKGEDFVHTDIPAVPDPS